MASAIPKFHVPTRDRVDIITEVYKLICEPKFIKYLPNAKIRFGEIFSQLVDNGICEYVMKYLKDNNKDIYDQCFGDEMNKERINRMIMMIITLVEESLVQKLQPLLLLQHRTKTQMLQVAGEAQHLVHSGQRQELLQLLLLQSLLLLLLLLMMMVQKAQMLVVVGLKQEQQESAQA